MDAYSVSGETEDPYDTTNRVRADLIKNGVYPEKVRGYAGEVLDGVDKGVERYRYAATLTEFVYEEVEHVGGGNQALYRPDYILEHDVESDCEDQAVLLASLLTVRSFTVRFVGAGNNDIGYHLMVQVEFPVDKVDELEEEARSFYSEDVELFYQEEGDSAWLLCDPVASPVIGSASTDYFRIRNRRELGFKEEVLYDYIQP